MKRASISPPARPDTTEPPPAAILSLDGQRTVRLCVGAGLLLLGLWILQDFVAALAWAAIFAIAAWPVYVRIADAMRGRRLLAPLLATLVVGIVFMAPFVGAGIALSREAHLVVDWVKHAQQSGLPTPDWLDHVPLFGEQAADWWRDNLSDPDSVADLLGRANTGVMVHWTGTLGTQVIRRVTVFAFMLLTLFFLFRDGPALNQRLVLIADRTMGPQGRRLMNHIVAAVHGTVNGLVLVGLGVGAVLAVAYLVAGVPHPALFGAVTAVLAIIPFGAPLALTVAALLLLAQGAMIPAVGLYAFGWAVIFVADHFIRPVLIGGAVRLPFLWVLLGILGGVATFGLLGLFLGPAIMAALLSIWRDWTDMPPETAEGGEP